MKNIKQLLLTAGMLIGCSAAMGQTGNGISLMPAFHWQCDPSPIGISSNANLNHNPALHITGDGMVFDSLPYAKDYTMIVVYRPDTNEETALWQLTFGDSATRGLTSERILSDSMSIRYAESTDASPAINTLRQSSPDSTAPYARLTVGGDGAMKVAEVLYYAERLGNAALRKIQSSLAVRYGITLGPVSYLDGAGRRVWDYADSGMYHHRVTGVGDDPATGLHQLRSRSEMGGAVLTLQADSLEEGAYLIAGDNDAPLTFEQDGDVEVLGRNWKTQSTMKGRHSFSLTFDTRNMAMPGDSLVLLVDNYIYLPERLGGDSVVFDDVEFPTDSSLFTLGRGGVFWQLAQNSGAKGTQGHHADTGAERARSHFTTRIYPNPTSGHYTLEVEGAEKVQVTIYNVHGTVMASFQADSRERYRFEGELPTGSVYYATVATESGSQTMKLVVK
ncbi:MAG: T9SS type A sorting domain-containing protein [Bacteroidales bacterium]|nr:T9SS type A sorting domain-containing protein [Bacteroidales bacterium]